MALALELTLALALSAVAERAVVVSGSAVVRAVALAVTWAFAVGSLGGAEQPMPIDRVAMMALPIAKERPELRAICGGLRLTSRV
ncbi:MAG: hypothetical protein U0271_22955 [Polyangiaceae bacterium]